MNNKQREVLHQNRHFLSKNIVWTEDLTNNLLVYGVLTDTLLADLQDDSSRHKQRKGRTARLLEVLPLRGAAMFDRFCDVLQMSGHAFIADFLRDEESGADIVDMKEVYKRLPVLDKLLKGHDKTTLDHLIISKVNEAMLRASWSKHAIAREKDKAIEAKQKQLEDAFEYERKEKIRLEEIQNLEKQVKLANNETIELRSQVNFLKSQMQESENKLKSDISVQMQFGMANENQIRKLNEKSVNSTRVLHSIEGTLKTLIDVPVRDSERQQMALMEFQFAFLLSDFDRFVEKYKVLLEIEKQYENLTFERNYILAQLGFHSQDNGGKAPSLISAYQEFAVKTDEDLTDLRTQLEKHSGVIEGQQAKISDLNKDLESKSNETKVKTAGHVWQNAIMGVMRAQLNDVKHDNRVKDTKLKVFESEITKQKAHIAELEASIQKERIQASTPLSIRSKDSQTPSAASRHMETDYEKSRRNNMLPPLGGGKVQYTTPSTTLELTSQTSRRPGRPPNPGGYARRFGDNRPSAQGPDGLVSHQLKLETRGLVHASGAVDNKLGNMSHGLGNLKAMHGKYIKNNAR